VQEVRTRRKAIVTSEKKDRNMQQHIYYDFALGIIVFLLLGLIYGKLNQYVIMKEIESQKFSNTE